MLNVYSLSALLMMGVLGVVPVTADEAAGAAAVEPAVLVVPVWDLPERPIPEGRVRVVQAGDHGEAVDVSAAARERRALAASRCPLVGSEYELVAAIEPNPLMPRLRYHVYVNLSDPGVARNYREWHRARRKAEREDRECKQNERDMRERRERLLNTHRRALSAGVERLREGEYRQAVLALELAADLNHGDPACRIHLAVARVALGHDGEAAAALLRALELQPKLVPIQLELERNCSSDAEYARLVAGLRARLKDKGHPTSREWYLLGFLEFQRNRLDAAYDAFIRARPGLPDDERLARFVRLTKPAVGTGTR